MRTPILVLVLLVACGKSQVADPDAGPVDPGPAMLDTDPGTDPGQDAVIPPVPWTPEARGYKVLRGVVHLHSRLSHDGCTPDNEGYPEDFLAQCLAEERAAPCANGIDFMLQSDHPANVRDATFEDAVHYQAASGDTLVNDDQGRPLANRITCPTGSSVPRSYFFVGAEGAKNMPVGLSKGIPREVFDTSYHDEVPLDQARAAITQVHAQGGYAFVAHPERDDLSVQRIRELPLDGIEIFNIHPMLMDALLIRFDEFLRVDAFMAPKSDNPSPDLAFLLLFAPVLKDVEKFDLVAPVVRMTAFAATDIHRNVEVPKLCGDVETCYEQYPNFSALLVQGGPPILGDGVRMDDYGRAFRWVANRALIPADAANEPEAIRQAVGTGRSYAAFDVMGSPSGFDFFAWVDGKPVEMGREVQDAKEATLYVRAPTLVAPPWGQKHVTDWSSATVRTKLIRATTAGATVVREAMGAGEAFAVKVDGAGAWRVEVWVTPKHLLPALKGVEDLAGREYPYIYSNAIFFR